jgi:hypothetical protein
MWWLLFPQSQNLRILEKLLSFGVILRLDLRVVDEIFLLALMLHVLEAVAINGVFLLVSGDIVYGNILGDSRAHISVWFTDSQLLKSNSDIQLRITHPT